MHERYGPLSRAIGAPSPRVAEITHVLDHKSEESFC